MRPFGPGAAFFIAYTLLLAGAFYAIAYTPTATYDEFTILSDGARLRAGELIYRDFFEFVTPLSPAFAALVFGAAGTSVLAARLAQGALLVGAGVLLYRLGRDFALPRPVAAVPGLALAFTCFPRWAYYSHHWLVVPFMALALWAAMRGLDEARGRRWWALAGLATGGAVLTVQSDGVAMGGVLVAGLVASALLGDASWRRTAVRGLAFGGGLAAALVPVGLYFLAQGALGAAWEAVWVFPTTQYRAAGNLNHIAFGQDWAPKLPDPAMPPQAWWPRAYQLTFSYLAMAAMPLLALGWGLGAIAARVRTRTPLAPEQVRFGVLALATLAAFVALTRGRADTTHVYVHLYFALVLAAVLAWRCWEARKASSLAWLRGLPLAALGLYVAFGAYQTGLHLAYLRPAIAAGIAPDAAIARDPALDWLRAHSAPTDRIAVFPWGAYYYLFGRPPATGYSLLLHPGVRYNTRAQFDEAMAQVAARRPRYVLISNPPPDPDQADNPYSRALPPGYRLVTTLRSPRIPQPLYVYEQDAPAGRP